MNTNDIIYDLKSNLVDKNPDGLLRSICNLILSFYEHTPVDKRELRDSLEKQFGISDNQSGIINRIRFGSNEIHRIIEIWNERENTDPILSFFAGQSQHRIYFCGNDQRIVYHSVEKDDMNNFYKLYGDCIDLSKFNLINYQQEFFKNI
jgi:hypothetical protein